MDLTSQPCLILPAGWRDLKAVRQVEQACFGDDTWPLVDILSVLVWPGIVRLKVVCAEQLAGFGTAEERSGVGWITSLGIAPAFRRRGLGRALLLACEERLSAPRIRLCVRRDNSSAQQLYLQTGYRQVDVWARYYRDREDAFVMEKSR